MVIIIHGDDVSQSTKKLDEYLRSKWVVRLDGKKSTLDEIRKSYQTDSLFTNEKTIIVENIKNAPKLSLEELINLTNQADNSVKTVIYHTDAIDSRVIKKFKSTQVFDYKLPKVYFQFLDGIVPGNAKNVHNMLQDLAKNYTAEQIFYSMVKRFRQLLMLATGNASAFDEITKMNDWQLIKLRKQAAAWDREDLVRMYKKLFELEKGMKTSSLPAKLLSHIDILLMSEL